MKKTIILVIAALYAIPASSGGLVTNTNQSAAFLRNMARSTTSGSDAIYYNPAGTAFMENGWHIGINNQQAIQRRWTNSSFAPFALGAGNGGKETKHFQGNTFSPIVPSVYLTYKMERLAFMFSMGIGSGGGSVEYKNGFASFESIIAQIPYAYSHLDPIVHFVPYKADIYLKGSSMTLTSLIGASYRISRNFALAAQLRIACTSNSYKGHITDIEIAQKQEYFGELLDNRILDTKQKGWGISPVIAVSFLSNGAHDGESFTENGRQDFGWGWSASAKYEFKTHIMLKNSTSSDVIMDGKGLYPNGDETESDLPSMLGLCASKHLGPVKLTAQWKYYFDRDVQNFFSSAINGGSDEFIFGIDWRLARRLVASSAIQRSLHEIGSERYSDMNFNNSSTSWGIGACINISRHLNLNAGCMLTFYGSVTRDADPYNSSTLPGIPGKDEYHRQSVCYGLGLDLNF